MRINALLTVLISTPVQWSMAWRVRILSRSNALGGLICLTSIVSLAFGSVTYMNGDRVMLQAGPQDWSTIEAGFIFPFIWFLSSAIADVIIAVSFIVILTRSRTGFSKTDGVLTRMTQLLVGTGTLTAFLTALDAALFYRAITDLMRTDTNILTAYTIPDFLLSKLYTNSLLATLNARIIWRNALLEGEGDSGTGNRSALRFDHHTTNASSELDTP
ncbi:hypothetical protein ONZ45_g13356 [Pleurotus djamor]|nr:hypothetical protein ONZ45_g13356 [Pleurotus djamor]